MVSEGSGSGCKVQIATSHKLSDMLLVPLSTGVLSQLKIIFSFFVKNAEQLESHGCPIERMLALLGFVYVWACVVIDGNIGRGGCPGSVGLNS